MERYKIARPDSMQWIFNGRGKVLSAPLQHDGVQRAQHLRRAVGIPLSLRFRREASGIRILDNETTRRRDTNDPCGWNFCYGAPFCIAPQDNTWFPHAERRTGPFHKNFKTGTVSFAIQTRNARLGTIERRCRWRSRLRTATPLR